MKTNMSNHTFFKTALRWVAVLTFTGVLWNTPAILAEYTVEDHSIRWTGSTPVKSHTGLLSPSELAVSLTDDGKIESLKVVLDMNSIDVTDLQGRQKNRLTDHLISEDFFHVEKYPEATFIMKEYKDGKMHGTISIRGVPKSIAIPVTVSGNPNKGWNLSGKFAFNRQDFNVNYANAGIIGIAKDKIIDDDIVLEIELTVK